MKMTGYATQFLGKTVTVTIDRQLGSKHPRHDFIYTLNYGYIAGTTAPDGECVDVYVLGVFEPLQKFTGSCIALIHRLTDKDDKLIVAPQGISFSNEQIRALTEFQERFFESNIIRK